MNFWVDAKTVKKRKIRRPFYNETVSGCIHIYTEHISYLIRPQAISARVAPSDVRWAGLHLLFQTRQIQAVAVSRRCSLRTQRAVENPRLKWRHLASLGRLAATRRVPVTLGSAICCMRSNVWPVNPFQSSPFISPRPLCYYESTTTIYSSLLLLLTTLRV